MNFALIGFPLGHSFSKKYFTDKFADLKLNLKYEACAMEDISEIQNWITQNSSLQGFNITIPHKINIIPHLTHLSEEAVKIGAVNCVKIYRNNNHIQTKGFNTDAFGFEYTLLSQLKPHHTKALVLGNGGAAKAVHYVLNKLKIPYLQVSRVRTQNTSIAYTDLNESLVKDYTLIINASPLGTFPKVEECPNIPYQYLSKHHLLYDLIYNPSETLFLQKGKQAGASIINGYPMLVQQAEKSWQIWNDNTL